MNVNPNNANNIDAAVAGVHQIISKRIVTHISHEILDLNSFINTTFNDQFINANIAGKLPQQPSNNE